MTIDGNLLTELLEEFQSSTEGIHGATIIYAPKMVIDNRRNAYQLKPPIPEVGKSFFRGNYWESGIHFYLSDNYYGSLRAGNSENKSWMFSSKHIVRFSDYDQLTVSNHSWTWDRTEEIYSFEHSFLELPFKKNQYLKYSEIIEYNLNIKDLTAIYSCLFLWHRTCSYLSVKCTQRNWEHCQGQRSPGKGCNGQSHVEDGYFSRNGRWGRQRAQYCRGPGAVHTGLHQFQDLLG